MACKGRDAPVGLLGQVRKVRELLAEGRSLIDEFTPLWWRWGVRWGTSHAETRFGCVLDELV